MFPNKMIDWQLIETAPRDRYVLLTDGNFFAGGQQANYIESETLGYDYGPNSAFESTLRPNPEAGKVRWYWSLNGCSSFSDAYLVETGFDPGEITDFEPTHWAEPFALPEVQKIVCKPLNLVVFN